MSEASGTIRRAGNPRSFKSAYNRVQRVAAAFALFSMLWFASQPPALAGTAVTLNNTAGLGLENAATGAGSNGAGFFTSWYNDGVLGTSGGVVGGYNFNQTPLATSILSTINIPNVTPQNDYNNNAAFRPPNVAGSNLGIVYDGVLNIGTGGTYTFATTSDDGTFVYVDGAQVVDNDFSQGATKRSGTITLTAGFHNVVVKYAQGGGGANNVFTYIGADTSNAEVLVGSVALGGGVPNTFTNNGSRTTGAFADTNFDISITAGTTGKISASQGVGVVTNTGTMTFGSNASATYLGGVIGSETGIVQSGNVTLSGTNTITVGAPQTSAGGIIRGFGTVAPLTISGNIGEAAGGSNLVLNAPWGLTLTGNNTYSGTTTVSAGSVFLNSAVGTAVGGNLTVNVAGSTTPNVTLLKANQINSNAIVTMTAGVLDLGAFDQTVNRVALNGQQVRGSGGTLTITDFSSSNLESGLISARLKNLNNQSDQILKSTAGTLTLAGDNSQYNGLITVNSGTLVAAANHALGADANPAQEFDRLISFSNDGQLQLRGNIDLGFQNLIFTGANNQAINNLSGTNKFSAGSITLVDGANLTSSSGNLVFGAGVQFQAGNLELRGAGDFTFNNNLFAQTATNSVGSLTMKGTGTLIFGSPQQANFQSKFTLESGNLGFTGPQNFGALTVPTGKSYRFNSDPGTGAGNDVILTVNQGANVIAGFTPTPAFLTHITNASTGGLLLTQDESTPIDLTGKSLSLGAQKTFVTYSGNLTPGTGGYRLGGGPGTLRVTQSLTGNNNLNINGSVILGGAANTFAGDVILNAGARLPIFSSNQLGNNNNKIVFNGGTLEVNNTNSNNQWQNVTLELGNPLFQGPRILEIGAAGGTLSLPAFADQQNNLYLNGTNQLTGTGTLTKTGNGSVWITTPQAFAGKLNIAPNGGRVDLRMAGTLSNVTEVTVGQGAIFQVSNNGGVNTNRQYLNNDVADTSASSVGRFNDAAIINLDGGRLTYEARASGSTGLEKFGTVNLRLGQSELHSARNLANPVGLGADMSLARINTSIGATLSIIATNNGTFGAAGDTSRITVGNLNGATTANNTFFGGFATYNANDFLNYTTQASAGTGAAGGLTVVGTNGTTGYNNYGAAAVSFGATDLANLNAAGNTTLNPGNQTLKALRFSGAGAQNLAFDTGGQQLFVTSGGILSDNQAQNRTIGLAADSGQITAGASGANTPQQLFMHVNQATLTINSRITDNTGVGGTVAVVKDLGGTLQLNDALNTYSGGTFVSRGTLTANAAGSLGTGNVLVNNSRLNLNFAGSIGGTTGSYTLINQAEAFVNNSADSSLVATERYIVGPGSNFIGLGGTNGANQGLNSFSRVFTTPTSAGQVQLAPDAIVGVATLANNPDNGAGVQTIKNLGTAADLYFGVFGTTAGANTGITVGPGTPWKGISGNRTTNNAVFNRGTITANGDFYLQGPIRDGIGSNNLGTLTLGVTGDGANYSIVNNASAPVNAIVVGQVQLSEDVPTALPADLTFVVTSGANLQTNFSRSLGNTNNAATNASVVVQAGGFLDTGALAGFGPTVTTTLNGNVTIEAGGRLLLNDNNGIGTQTAAGAKWTIKKDGILELANSQAFVGNNSANHLINTDQFVYETGAIVRMNADNIYGLSTGVSAQQGGTHVIYELVAQNDRTLSTATAPGIFDAVNPTQALRAPSTIRVDSGGGFTNNTTDLQFRADTGTGTVLMGDGSFLAGTNQTLLRWNAPTVYDAGATINIGFNGNIDGHPKLGAVRLGENSNPGAGGVGGKFNVIQDAELFLTNANSVPDRMGINLAGTPLPAAPLATPDANVPGQGSVLFLDYDNIETIGKLTGTGSVVTNHGGAFLQVGYGLAAGDNFVFDGQISNQRGGNPILIKAGDSRMDLTSTNVATNGGSGNNSTQQINVYGGILALSGQGAVQSSDVQFGKSGTFLLDNSGTAKNDRLLGTGSKNLRPLGGSFILQGNAATAVTENVFLLRTDSNGNVGGMGTFNVQLAAGATPAVTRLNFTTIQNYNLAGTNSFVFRGTGLGGTAGTYNAAGVYTPGVAVTNGFISATNPNLTTQLQQNVQVNTNNGTVIGAGLGSPFVGTRPDILGSLDPNSQWGERYVTQDAQATGFRLLADSEYQNAVRNYMDETNGTYNARLLTGQTQNVYGSVRLNSLTMQPGSSLNVVGPRPVGVTPSRLQIFATGVLAEAGGTATLATDASNFLVNPNGNGWYFHTLGNLNVNGNVLAANGIIKTGPGTLTLGSGPGSLSSSVYGNFISINGGTTILKDHTVFRTGQNNFSSQQLLMNDGTLDLNGNNQVFQGIQSANPLPGLGGTLTNTSATTSTLSTHEARTFGGHLNGNVNWIKNWVTEQILTSDNNYTGTTVIKNGGIQFRDSGTITQTSRIDLTYGTLQFDNKYLGGAVNNRVPNNIDVNMDGARVNLFGTAAATVKQEFGTVGNKNVNMIAGYNNFRVDAGNGGQTNMIINNLNRSLGATANFESGFGTLGYPGNLPAARGTLAADQYGTDPHIYLNQVNGVSTAAASANGSSTINTNNILGGWAIVNNSNFATYLPTVGIVGLGDVNIGGLPFVGYDAAGNNIAAWTNTTNVSFGNNPSANLAGDVKLNALRMTDGGADPTMTFAAGATLTLTSGGLLTTQNRPVKIGSVPGEGKLTSAGPELFVFANGNNTTFINSIVTDNANGAVTFVKHGQANVQLNTANTYTGGTIVASNTLFLGAAGAIPGDAIINGWSSDTGGGARGSTTITELVSQGLKPTANVTVNGGGFLRMFNSAAPETLNSVTLNNNGGGNPGAGLYGVNATTNGVLNLTSPNAITAIDSALITRPTVDPSIGTINFSGNYVAGNGHLHVVGDAQAQEVGLNFLANIGTVPNNGVGIVKTGNGMLAIRGTAATQFGNPANFTNVFDIKEGIVRVEEANSLGNNKAVTTVENGAALVGGYTKTVLGSLRLNTGSTLGTTEGTTTFGAAGINATNFAASQSVINVAGNTTIKLSDYFLDVDQTRDIVVNAKLTGSGNINLVGPRGAQIFSTLRLANDLTAGVADDGFNDYSGTITINRGAILLAQPATFSTGNELGTATIRMNGGQLQLRDNTATDGNVAETIDYSNNNVILSADSLIGVAQATGNLNSNANVIKLGTLTVEGTNSLRVDSGNGYKLAFTRLAGSGTVIKDGTGPVAYGTASNSYAGFTGTIVLGGPRGTAIQAGNVILLNSSTTNRLNALQIDGAWTTNTVLHVGTLATGDNAGTVGNGTNGVTTGSMPGAIAVASTSNLTTTVSIRNNGQMGGSGGPVTLTAPVFTGSGRYITFNQPLTLKGALADDGANPTVLRAVGNNVINFTPTGAGANTGGADIQNGTFRIAGATPLINPLGTGAGTIRVLGAPATVLSAASKTSPVAALNGTLQFDAANVTQAGNIANTGTVQVKSGNTTVSGVISGTPQFVPGLLEGVVVAAYDSTAARPANPGNFGIRLEPRMGQTQLVTQNPLTGWGDNHTWIYTGQFFDADGKFSFIANIDDNALVTIDGTEALKVAGGGANRPVSTAWTVAAGLGANVAGSNQAAGGGTDAFGMGPLGDGWHNIEIRFNNGGGNAGPVTGTGFTTNYGFGLNQDGRAALDGQLYSRPIDPGDGSLFRTAVGGTDKVLVESGATLGAGGLNSVSLLQLNSDGANAAGGTFLMTDKATMTNSSLNALNVVGATGNVVGTVTLGSNNTLFTNTLNLPAITAPVTGSKLIVNGTGTSGPLGILSVATPTIPTGAVLQVNGGQVNVTGTQVGGGTAVVSGGVLNVSGSVNNLASVTVNGGDFQAAASQRVKLLTVTSGQATVLPGAPKVLTVGDGTTASPLAVSGTGKIDVNSGLIIDYAVGNDTARLTQVRQLIIQGYNASAALNDGNFMGNGITSTIAQGNGSRAVGYAMPSEILVNGRTDFMGQTPDASSILVRLTLAGDATLDGAVDFNDLVQLAQNYNTTVSATTNSWWFNGDFTHDGVVDFNDLVKLAQNYNTALPTEPVLGAPANFQGDLAAAFSAVPEPGSLGVLALAGLALLRRRNRR